MRMARFISNPILTAIALFVLAIPCHFAEAQQSYQATIGNAPWPPTYNSIQGTYFACPNDADDGPYAQDYVTQNGFGTPLSNGSCQSEPCGTALLISGIQFIQQDGKWVPATSTTATVQPNPAGDNGSIPQVTTSTLSSAGVVIATFTATWSGLSSVDPTTGADLVQTGIATGTLTLVLGDGSANWQYLTTESNTVNATGECSEAYVQTEAEAGSSPVSLTPISAIQPTLSVVDPANVGGLILPLPPTVDPNSVPNAPGANGISADGTSAAAIVFHSNSSSVPVTFSLAGTEIFSGGEPGGPVGTLGPFAPDYLMNPQPGSQSSVTVEAPLSTDTCDATTDQAGTSDCTFLALLWAPAQMPYSAADLTALTPEDVLLTITASQADVTGVVGTTTASTLLMPPPVVLVHGLWATAANTWPTFAPWLQQQYPTSGILTPTYNGQLSFATLGNQTVFAQSVSDALTKAADLGIVARKVDVVAHSMGGLVTLCYIGQCSTPAPVVPLPPNPIHKLVTVGIPHDGSPLATTLWTARNDPPITLNALITNPIFQAACSAWVPKVSLCTPTILFQALGKPIDTAIESLQNGLDTSTTSYSAVVGETAGFGATEAILDALLAIYVPGDTVAGLLGNGNDAVVAAASQSSEARGVTGRTQDFATVTGVVHTSLWPQFPWLPKLDFPSETASSAVWTQMLSSLMGNPLSGSVAQPQERDSRLSGDLPLRAATRLESAAASEGSTSTPPIFDLTGYAQVPISNATFLPASGSTLTINSTVTITVTSATKTIAETLLLQKAADPTDFTSIYSTTAPFSLSFVPTRLGSMSFVVFAIFTDNTFATTTLNYTLAPSGSPLDVRLPNPPLSALGLGQNANVNAVADFSNGPVDVTSAASYSARSGGTSVFSVGTNGSITAIGNGVDWLDASYQGVVGSALISVGQCNYTLTPTNEVVDYGGGSFTIQVSTQSGCAWTASSDSGWLSFGNASGNGSASINAMAAANASGSQRTAFVKVGNVFVTVTQPATSCSYAPSPSEISLSSVGGSGTISVSTSCPFTSSSDESWATVMTLSQSSVAYSVAANSSPQARTATLSIGTGQVTITQSGALAAAVTPTFSPPGGTYASAQQVMISDSTAGATIYYTTNGTTPTTSSTQYTGAIMVNSTETIEAIAAASGYSTSPVATATYTIGSLSTASVAPPSLTFSAQAIGTTSTSQPVTLNNTGNATLTITSITATGDFSQTNTCAGSLAAGSSCTINVSFKPTTTGTSTDMLTITDNSNGVAGSTQTVSLTGTATAPVADVSPATLTFAALMVNSKSNTQAVTLSNAGNLALVVGSISTSGNFAQTNNCGSSVAAGGSCTINVTFTPSAGGPLTGNLTITDNSNNTTGNTQTVSLSGTGEDYTLTTPSGSSSSATVSQGQTATFTLAVGAEGGMNQSVNFSCTDPASESACTVSPNPANPGSNLTVTATTTAPSLIAPRTFRLPHLPDPQSLPVLALLLACFGWTLARKPRLFSRKQESPRASRCRVLLPLAAGLLLLLALAGCGGGANAPTSNPGTPPDTYTLTVTGTVGSGSNAVSHSVKLTLTVS